MKHVATGQTRSGFRSLRSWGGGTPQYLATKTVDNKFVNHKRAVKNLNLLGFMYVCLLFRYFFGDKPPGISGYSSAVSACKGDAWPLCALDGLWWEGFSGLRPFPSGNIAMKNGPLIDD